MSKPIHYVKIVDGKIKFECQDVTATCHTYPACDCESFNKEHSAESGRGHEMVHHAECWMQGWFDNGGAVYVGDDREDGADLGVPAGMNREGFVTSEWEDDWVEFEFAELTDNASRAAFLKTAMEDPEGRRLADAAVVLAADDAGGTI